jgi:glyoxylase-like metal-dependent hydrolase (beta-lactamase superfamily II)
MPGTFHAAICAAIFAMAMSGTTSLAQTPEEKAARIRELLGARMRELAAATIEVKPLRGEAYWIPGGPSGAANTAFVVGDTGVIAIDAQLFVLMAAKERAEIARITSKPVNVMILTHSDPDHINGLPGWPRGMEIIAQQNVKAGIERVVVDPTTNGSPPPPEIRDYVPTHAVKTKERLVRNGVALELLHVAPAHTNGDLVTYLPRQKLVFAGDLLAPNVDYYPGVHTFKGGSLAGWIKTMKTILALHADIYVPGHGDILSKAELRKRLADTTARRDAIGAMVGKGLTVEQIKAALHEAEPTGAAALFPSFTENTVEEITAPARCAEIKALVDKGMTLEQIKIAVHEAAPKGAAAMFPTFTERTYRGIVSSKGLSGARAATP